MEELSILQMLTKQQGNRSFVDLLYLMTRQEAGGEDIRAYTNCFMGVDYVSPFAGPEEMADVEKETWVAFFQQLMASDYDTVVLLFGRTIPRLSGNHIGLSGTDRSGKTRRLLPDESGKICRIRREPLHGSAGT